MKISIIIPQYRGPYYELPTGLLYISSNLKKQGHEIKINNLNDEGLNISLDTEVVMIGGLSVVFNQIKHIVNQVRLLLPNAKVIVGGGLVSSMPELMHKELGADLSVVGEGEYLDVDATGIVKMDTITNLDNLPFPDYDGINIKGYLDRQRCGDEYYLYPVDKPRAMPIITSRSCPYDCSFCFHPLGRSYRKRSLDNVFTEIEWLIEKYQINILTVLDELIANFPERLELFCQRIKKYNIKWLSQIRVDSITNDTVKMMHDSGCFVVSIGIEHINQKVLDGYNKKITVEQIENALEILYTNKVGIQGNILLGGPDETPETVQEVIAWQNKNYKYMINTSRVIPYPGTKLFELGVKLGKINPIEFLENDCPFIHFSVAKTKIPAVLFKASRKNKCPHCKSANKYEGLYWGSTGVSFTHKKSYRIGCKNCNQRYDMDGV